MATNSFDKSKHYGREDGNCHCMLLLDDILADLYSAGVMHTIDPCVDCWFLHFLLLYFSAGN